ncbi:alpha-L-arabinofuranosidase C-terminal domain-containing protein [Niabella insulamsoli]|uniref:alpha-L-arabinofuranosidase C-terminal domain-containing protein n=1 Tax=Niabella insulamsoli TaxID=3144874 RepID=UPI0031FBF5D3
MKLKKLLISGLIFLSIGASAQVKQLTIKPHQPLAQISPTMWGVFFEDINMGADGGIYAELVKNRSFEFFKPLMGWKLHQEPFSEGSVLIQNRGEAHTNNPRYARVTVDKRKQGQLTLTNEGFRGMGIKKDLRYDFSMLYKMISGKVELLVELLDQKGGVIGSTKLSPVAGQQQWTKLEGAFKSAAREEKGALRLGFEGEGIIDIDMVSLFPEDTWKKRPGGMRADMVQMLADMKPGFVRFPGGCIVEGFDLAQRYQWKKTVGPVEERQLIINRWNYEFPHRSTPDYFQTFGLGFFEYFQLCDDIGAEPLPILNCGMACQFNSGEVVPLDQLQPYIDDALDLIEFANGNASTKWGKLRAEMGHPQPFHLKMLGVGNENWGPQYLERFKIFQKALKEKHPEIKLIASSGTDPQGAKFDFLNKGLRAAHVDFIDEHYYRPPQFFFEQVKRYDNYPRNGSKVFAGEYASHTQGTSGATRNNWLAALSEAAFLTGLERNADVVQMASYAPLFAHYDGWQWAPDLIWVDNLNVVGSPSYYVQKLYATNRGTETVPALLNGAVLAGQDSLYATAAIDAASGEIILKIVNASPEQQKMELEIEGIRKWEPVAAHTILTSENLTTVNSLKDPAAVQPKTASIRLAGKKPTLLLKGYSFNVYRIKYR